MKRSILISMPNGEVKIAKDIKIYCEKIEIRQRSCLFCSLAYWVMKVFRLVKVFNSYDIQMGNFTRSIDLRLSLNPSFYERIFRIKGDQI